MLKRRRLTREASSLNFVKVDAREILDDYLIAAFMRRHDSGYLNAERYGSFFRTPQINTSG